MYNSVSTSNPAFELLPKTQHCLVVERLKGSRGLCLQKLIVSGDKIAL